MKQHKFRAIAALACMLMTIITGYTHKLGIAISNGAAIAREIADITISEDNLNGIITARKLALSMMKRIERNYRSILTVNGALIALGVAGIVQPTLTATIHNASTIGIGLMSTKKLLQD